MPANGGLELTTMRFTLRRATPCDADAIANVYSSSFRLLTFLPMLHTIEEYRSFIANVILKECEVTVAEDETGIVAFLTRQGEEIGSSIRGLIGSAWVRAHS